MTKICGEELAHSEGTCDNRAKFPDGKCGMHTENNNFGGEGWKPNYEHGLYMDRSGYYQELGDQDKRWIDAVTQSFVEECPYDSDNIGIMEKLRQVAIDLHKRRRADEYIMNKGMTQSQPVGYHEEYGEIEQEEENVLHITADRLSRESRMTLKDLGVIGNKQKEKNEELGESLIEALSQSD